MTVDTCCGTTEPHEHEDRHMFHAYVSGGDMDTCPCDDCSEERRAQFEDEHEWALNEEEIAEAHSDAVEGWARHHGLTKTELSPAEVSALRQAQERLTQTQDAFRAAVRDRASLLHAYRDAGVSNRRLASVIGCTPSAVQQIVARAERGGDAG